MKTNKALLLLAIIAMCVTGCNKNGKSSGSSNQTVTSNEPESLPVPISPEPEQPSIEQSSLIEPSIEQSSLIESSSEQSSSESSSIEQSSSEMSSSEESFPELVGSLTLPEGDVGFPRNEVDNFLSTNSMTDSFVPTIADDQAWDFKIYSYFPIMKLWTKESTNGTLYEDQYFHILVDAGVTSSEKYYNTIGYSVLDSNNMPTVTYKSVPGYFVIYISATAYPVTPTADGAFPMDQLDEYFDLMNIENVPSFPRLSLDTGWEYQNFFYVDKNIQSWRLFIKHEDLNSPNSSNIIDDSLEDIYKELLIADGWEINELYYASYGYYATKEWVEIQFFSWDDAFRIWVYKK